MKQSAAYERIHIVLKAKNYDFPQKKKNGFLKGGPFQAAVSALL